MILAELTEMVSHACPDWPIASIQYLAEGDFCVAYLVNDAWVFRFGKHDEARASLRREYCLLPMLARNLTLAIPVPKLARLEETDWPFIAYPWLPGPALSKERYRALDTATRTRCATQVGTFLTQLHAIDPAPAHTCGVPMNAYADRFTELLVQASEKLYPLLAKPERAFIEQTINGYLDAGYASAYRPSLLHGDLSPDHVLFSEAATNVSAIIDFGDMMIGDPAWDLAFIYEDYGLDFLARLLATYVDGLDCNALLQRLYQLYLIAAIDWIVNHQPDLTGLAEAGAQLRLLRLQAEQGREELLTFCQVA